MIIWRFQDKTDSQFYSIQNKLSDALSVNVLGNVTVATYYQGTQQESKTGTSLLTGNLLNSNGESTIGFVATLPFDEIRYSEYRLTVGGLSTTEIYYPVIIRFCDANPFPTVCNVPTNVKQGDGTNTNYPVFASGGSNTVACLNCAVKDVDNVVDGDANNFAVISSLASFLSENYISVVTKQSTKYPIGTYAGFEIQDIIGASAAVGNNHTVTFYNSTTGQSETVQDGGALVSGSFFTSSGRQVVGFKSTIEFDEVRFSTAQLAGGGLATTNVFNFIVERFCAGPDLTACNTNVRLKSPEYPVFVDARNTGVQVVAGLRTDLRNSQQVIDSDDSNWAEMEFMASGGATASLAVANGANSYPAGTFAGFDISNNQLVGANALSGITITTLDANGGVVQTINASSGLVSLNSSIVSGTGRQIVGFVSTAPFYGVKITVNQTASLALGTIRIYSAIIKKFCTGTALVCKTMTPLTNPGYPVYVNGRNTGIDAAGCAGCNLNNSENVINAGTTIPATLVLNASAASSAKFSVANPLDTYPAGTFAGFDISSATLANINVIGSTRITLWNNGSAVQTGAGTSLLAGATVLSGDRQIIGTVAQVPFDEIQIEFNQLGGANPLGTISIYRAVIQTSCETPIACNQTIYLNTGNSSAVIEGTRTGFSGAASIGDSYIRDPWAAVTPSTTDFARIRNLAGAAVTGSISVADPATVYPAGTFAGFTISKGDFLISGALLPYLTVSTYLDGQPTGDSRSAGNLLDLNVFIQIFGAPNGLANIGFVATKPFDEIRLTVGSLAGALANFVDVYGAFVDTRYSSNGGSLICATTLNPDFNVTTKNVPVSGNVSTNDKVPTGTTYGTPVPSGSNPSGATITMNPNGTYSFTATQPGTFTYTVPVCPPGQTTGCPTSPLIITVLDPSITTNPPVANPDYVTTTQNTPVTINVKANDGPGNVGGVLGIPTVVTQPANGSVVMVGDNAVYTPATGFVGDDTFSYQVCETPGGLCKTTTVTVHVMPTGSSTVSVVDDYNKTPLNTPVAGNVLTNDKGSGLTVTNPGTFTNSAGSLVLQANGTYTFTPRTGVSGPTSFTYTACDNSSPSVCGTATLYILVGRAPDLTPILKIEPTTVYGTKAVTVYVDVYELRGVATNGLVTVQISKDPRLVLNFNQITSIGGILVDNANWLLTDLSNSVFYTLTTTQSILGGGLRKLGLTGTLTPGTSTGTITLTTRISGGGEVNLFNNTDAERVDYFQQ